jgi:hypothetical protein
VPGRSARRARGLRRVSCLPRRTSDAVTWPRSGTVTLPRFATETNMTRACRPRWTRRPPNVMWRTMRPGTRMVMRTPRRTRTLTRPPRSGRVVSRTRTGWSPGSARRGGLTRSVKIALSPERSSKRAGTIWSHVFAAGCRPTVRRVTTTTTRSAPSFRSLILLAPGAASVSLAGETESATRGRSALAPSAEGAGASRSTVKPASARAGLTGRRR